MQKVREWLGLRVSCSCGRRVLAHYKTSTGKICLRCLNRKWTALLDPEDRAEFLKTLSQP